MTSGRMWDDMAFKRHFFFTNFQSTFAYMKKPENSLVLNCSSEAPKVEYSKLSSEEQEKILHLQQAILESVARGADHREVINQVCLLEEQLLPNSVASVMLMDEAYEFLNVYAAPSVPPEGIVR